ncbi:MAG: hypothetical protein JO023_27460 [Chloroflexi bacterium]|nr:hypothetical protein [Chloroflexota bacterium]
MPTFRSLLTTLPRLLACGVLIGAVAVSPAPALASGDLSSGGPVVSVTAPASGTQLPDGVYTVTAIAHDPRARTYPGVDRVQFFLDDRDHGGHLLATAELAPLDRPLPNPRGNAIDPSGSMNVRIDLSGLFGPHTLYAYAHSAADGRESSVAVPITIGVTRPRALPPAETPTPQHSGIQLFVDNPALGELVAPGPHWVQGRASDQRATAGTSGIDRVQVFLGDRNAGGRLLAEAQLTAGGDQWRALTDLSGLVGSYNLYVYARSSVDGTEQATFRPVMVS